MDIRLLNRPRFDQIALELIAHERSVEGSVYFPLGATSKGHVRFSIYGQVFYGDAERLLTLDQRVTNYCVGFGSI